MKFLSTREVAERVGVSARTVQRWIKAGKIKAIRKPMPQGGIAYRIPEEEIKKICKENLFVAAMEEETLSEKILKFLDWVKIVLDLEEIEVSEAVKKEIKAKVYAYLRELRAKLQENTNEEEQVRCK